MPEPRSLCPINLSLEIFGDRWTLLILRDIIFGNRRSYRELLQSQEGISTSVLADRLRRLVDEGVLTREDDPSHKQKTLYFLTEQGIDLVPIIVAMASWGTRWLPVSDELSARAKFLTNGGPQLLETLMEELRARHIVRVTPTVSILAMIEGAFQAARSTKPAAQ